MSFHDGRPLPNDPVYLRDQQYASPANLDARIALHQNFSTNHYGWMRWVFDHFETLPATARILELGCGPGTLWQENLARVPVGWTITLSDFSPGMLNQAQQQLAGSALGFNFGLVDIQDIPYASASFDAVIANHMLYHAADRRRAIAEVRRVLRPDGIFFAATNGARHMQELVDLCDRFDPSLDLFRASMAESFSLENGVAQLAQSFANVALDQYEDGLNVTEVEPLVRYVDSTAHMDALLSERFRRYAQRQLDANHGVLHIHKVSGLFRAWSNG